MNTWEIDKLMNGGVKKSFNAPTIGPDDAIKFGSKTQEKKPTWNCNTKHEVQGWRTRSGSYNDSDPCVTDLFDRVQAKGSRRKP